MVTFVGNPENFAEALKELIELDCAAVDAYGAAIKRLESPEYQRKLREFRQDHRRHSRDLLALLKKNNQEAPEKGLMNKQLPATGKVFLANMVGKNTILYAMKNNEMDTKAAYERINGHKDKWPDAENILKRGLQDVRRHKEWLEKALPH